MISVRRSTGLQLGQGLTTGSSGRAGLPLTQGRDKRSAAEHRPLAGAIAREGQGETSRLADLMAITSHV